MAEIFRVLFPFIDQIVAFRRIMLAQRWGKVNHHFPYVVAVMNSNNALLRSKLFNPIKHMF